MALGVPCPGGTAHALLCPQWSEDVCAAHLTQRDGYQATTQGQLKEQLYQEIIHYFDKGKVRAAGGPVPPCASLRCVHTRGCGTGSLSPVVCWEAPCVLPIES